MKFQMYDDMFTLNDVADVLDQSYNNTKKSLMFDLNQLERYIEVNMKIKKDDDQSKSYKTGFKRCIFDETLSHQFNEEYIKTSICPDITPQIEKEMILRGQDENSEYQGENH